MKDIKKQIKIGRKEKTSLPVHIIKNYYYEIDQYQIVLKRETTSDSGNTYMLNIGFFTTLQTLLKYLLHQCLKDEIKKNEIKNIEDSIAKLEELYSNIDTCKNS